MGNTTTLVIPTQHPAFGGHFPGAPLLPGVVLLDEMLRVLESSGITGAWTLSSAKFLHPVRPGETLAFEHEVLTNGAIRFSIRSVGMAAGTLVATGTLTSRHPTRGNGDGHEAG